MWSFKEKLTPFTAFSKYALVSFNFFFLVMGIFMTAAALYFSIFTFHYYNLEQSYSNYFDTRFFSLVGTLFTIGIIMTAVSVPGLVGAYRESIFVLMLFSVGLGTVLILEVTFATTQYIMRDQIKDSLTKAMSTMMRDYDHIAASQRTVDTVQHVLQCCGTNSCQEWDKDLPYFNRFAWKEYYNQPKQFALTFKECRVNTTDGARNVRLPDSCCKNRDDYGGCLEISVQGCIPRFEFLAYNYSLCLAVLVAVIQITGIIFACLFAKTLYVKKIRRGMIYSLLQEECVKK